MRPRALAAGAVAAALFALYAASAPRTVALEDDGFFILSSYFLGVAHPPGYPLFTALGKLATLVPLGSVAYRVHLLSAAFGAASCAVLWLCARALLESRAAAALAALGLGLSAAFWSQSIIAEVYTLNTLFAFALLYLALREGPLWAMALLFGLSLANHWPLMLLVAPAYLVLLWPRRRELLRGLPWLVPIVAAGLLPYAWMAWRSHAPLPTSFSGPIGSWFEFWFFVSRGGYAEVDASRTADWLDRLNYFRYEGGQVLLQFAVAGALLAAWGFWLQWRQWGTRVAAALTLAFVMPSFVLLLLLGFDYDAFHKHVYHVYPLPAYGVAALWMGLGFGQAMQRFAWGRAARVASASALLLFIAAAGARGNLLAGYSWVERYGRTLLESMPKDAIVLLKGADVGPLAYLHLVEGVRPDLTLYHPQGLVLGNRLFHPIRTEPALQQAAVRDLVSRATVPVATTAPLLGGFAWREHWLYATLDREREAGVVVDVPPDLARYFDEQVRSPVERNAFIAFYQGELRRRYAGFAAQAGDWRALESLGQDFYGALGGAEGLLSRREGYPLKEAVRLLQSAGELIPADASKQQRARYLELRGYVRLALGDRAGALSDLRASVAAWPVAANAAAGTLRRLEAP